MRSKLATCKLHTVQTAIEDVVSTVQMTTGVHVTFHLTIPQEGNLWSVFKGQNILSVSCKHSHVHEFMRHET